MQIALTGDVMLGRLVDQYVIRNQSIGPDKIWSDVLPLMLRADRRLINLECVISDRGREWQPDSKAFHFRGHPAGPFASCLRRAGHRNSAVPKWFSRSLLKPVHHVRRRG